VAIKTFKYAVSGFIFTFLYLYIILFITQTTNTNAPIMLIFYLPYFIFLGALIGLMEGLSKKSLVVKTLRNGFYGFIFTFPLAFILTLAFGGHYYKNLENILFLYAHFLLGFGVLIGLIKGYSKKKDEISKNESKEVNIKTDVKNSEKLNDIWIIIKKIIGF